jgi:hypothetical protein
MASEQASQRAFIGVSALLFAAGGCVTHRPPELRVALSAALAQQEKNFATGSRLEQ